MAAGYSPTLGFIHTSKQLSFVYDIADLYKADLTIPLAFQSAAQGAQNLESRVRRACRDRFHQDRFLSCIVPDLQRLLNIAPQEEDALWDADAAQPSGLWSPGEGAVAGGVNYADAENIEPE